MEEKQQDKFYHSIGEVAKMLNVNTSLIRFWEKEFPGIKPKKNRKGNRLFTQKDVENLKYIYFLVKEQGHTHEGAKRILKSKYKKAHKQYDIAETLKKLRSFLVEIKDDLEEKS